MANPDSDSVSELDPTARTLVREIPLATAPPAADPVTRRFDPSVSPRAVALAPRHHALFVTGQRSGELYQLDLDSGAVARHVTVGSEPVGVLVSQDESSVFVACAQDALVLRLDTATLTVQARATTAWKPWALARSDDGATVYVSHLLGPGVTVLAADTLTARAQWTVPDTPPRAGPRLFNGQPRGLYDLVVRPGAGGLYIPHLLLATNTPQPRLDFETTVFPTVTALDDTGSVTARWSTDAGDIPGIDGAFGDVVSGPRAIEFTPDGRYALVLDAASEDVLAVDATRGVEATLLRPLPGHLPEGLVLSPDGTRAYVDERNSGDVAALSVRESTAGITLSIDGAIIPRLVRDPMPPDLREGQHLFFSANSDEEPVTTDHWVACASCHIEARSDAVTWRFVPGPRDTPSNAGGTLGTGLLFRTADRARVRDYWRTDQIEQGGRLSAGDPEMLALESFVDLGIPLPVPPATDATLVAHGDEIFHRASVGCASCHSSDAFTDSGMGNAARDLSGPVVLHDVGTCNTGGFPDVPHTDDQGNPRAACVFDTPSLRGIADSAPYLHDGSAATLRDVLEVTRGKMGDISGLSDEDLNALVEYLRSL